MSKKLKLSTELDCGADLGGYNLVNKYFMSY